MRAGARNDLTDVGGMAVGHFQRRGRGWLTGTTVVLPPVGTTGGVDVRGGGPGTRETDLLDPANMVSSVDAICLTGGSAYGLDAAGRRDGRARAARAAASRSVPSRGNVVPIVPGRRRVRPRRRRLVRQPPRRHVRRAGHRGGVDPSASARARWGPARGPTPPR